MPELDYVPLEKLRIAKPTDRIGYVVDHCRGRNVLDLGCYDETALDKTETDRWLHGKIAEVAASVIGIDSSVGIPDEGLVTGPTSTIYRGDATALDLDVLDGAKVDVIIAGELIEHLDNTLAFLRVVKERFPGKELIATTPNATSLANAALALVARESNHPDHVQIYSYKTLNTVASRVGFSDWEIVPSHVQFTEMALRTTSPAKRRIVETMEAAVNRAERAFPLTSGGLILHVRSI
jgi:SAM-dependent methyltransferase